MKTNGWNKIIFYIILTLSVMVWIWTLAAFLGSGTSKETFFYIISLLPILLWICGLSLRKLLKDKNSKVFCRVLYIILLFIVAIFFLINIFNNLTSDLCIGNRYHKYITLCNFNQWLFIHNFTIFYSFFNIFSFCLGFLFKNSLETKKGEAKK